MIASTDKAVKGNENTFTTASLATSDLQNKADYQASSASLNPELVGKKKVAQEDLQRRDVIPRMPGLT